MKGLIVSSILILLVLLPAWPLFFRRWKYGNSLWLVATLLIVSLGGWSLIYFQLERHYARLAEAEAVEATRKALVSGVDPQELADALEKLEADDGFDAAGVRSRYRLWYDTVKGGGL